MKHIILGFGSIGKRHYSNLNRLLSEGDSILTVDPDPDSGAAYREPPMSMEGCAIYIYSPTDTHHYWLIRAMNENAAGVFVEKPLWAKHLPLISIPSASQTKVACGYCYRFHPLFRDLKLLVGKQIRYLHLSANDNLRDRYGDTALETMASHSIDAVLWAIGPAHDWHVIDTGRRAIITLSHANCTTQIYCDIGWGPRRAEMYFSCDGKGIIKIAIYPYDRMYLDEMTAWLKYLKTGEIGDLCSFDEAKRVQEIVKC